MNPYITSYVTILLSIISEVLYILVFVIFRLFNVSKKLINRFILKRRNLLDHDLLYSVIVFVAKKHF